MQRKGNVDASMGDEGRLLNTKAKIPSTRLQPLNIMDINTATNVIHLKASVQAADGPHPDSPCSASVDLRVHLEESEWTSDADLVAAPAVAEQSKVVHWKQRAQATYAGRVRVEGAVKLGFDLGVELAPEVEAMVEVARTAAKYSFPEESTVGGELADLKGLRLVSRP